MKREETIVICERCGKEITLKAKKILGLRKSAKYPKNWAKIWDKKRVCDTCHAEFLETWQKFINPK
jgi:hypothetical protein